MGGAVPLGGGGCKSEGGNAIYEIIQFKNNCCMFVFGGEDQIQKGEFIFEKYVLFNIVF